jgi:CMP-N-acetylneuraminic acid synthetase
MQRVAIIPAKENSSRVPHKNFREFHNGRSLTEIKVRQVAECGVYDQVVISSDSPEANKIAEKYGARFILRDKKFTLDSTPWSEVFVGVLESLDIQDANVEISWCPPTTPLFSSFREAVETFESVRSDHDSLFTTTSFKHFLLGDGGRPLNFQFGPWARYSQGMPDWRVMNCALWHSTLGTMLKYQYQIGVTPYLFDIGQDEGWDIDTETEFEIAQLLYVRKWGIR